MSHLFTQPRAIKIIARWALVLFAMAWVNLAIQAPVHAAMKQSNDTPCHCVVTWCDTVLNLEEQSDDALGSLLAMSIDFKVAFVSTVAIDAVQMMDSLRLRHTSLDFRQYNPPPLQLNTILLI